MGTKARTLALLASFFLATVIALSWGLNTESRAENDTNQRLRDSLVQLLRDNDIDFAYQGHAQPGKSTRMRWSELVIENSLAAVDDYESELYPSFASGRGRSLVLWDKLKLSIDQRGLSVISNELCDPSIHLSVKLRNLTYTLSGESCDVLLSKLEAFALENDIAFNVREVSMADDKTVTIIQRP